jgi:shikimate kinase
MSTILPADATGEKRVPHAILIGLPGVGKSTVGRRVARMMGREFVDFDDEIARREGMSVQEIFRTSGEPHFRKLELDLTRELAPRDAMILAPGGGWICQREAAELLGGTGRTIYLRVTPESVFRRSGRISERPLLAGPDPLGKLRELHEQRRHLYEMSDYVVNAETLTKEQLISEVARIVASLDEE